MTDPAREAAGHIIAIADQQNGAKVMYAPADALIALARAYLARPTAGDDREALAQIICEADLHSPLEKAGANHRRIADAILASGFRRDGSPK